MDHTTLLIFGIIFILSWFLLRKRPRTPPGSFALPYVGTISIMNEMRARRPHEVLFDESKRHGPIFSWKIGNQLFVVLNTYDVIHECLVKQGEASSARPWFVGQIFNMLEGEEGILFSQYDQSLKDRRRFTLQALRDFGVGKTSIEENILFEVDTLTEALKKTQGKPIEINEYMEKIIGNITFGIVFGKRYEYDDPQLAKLLGMTTAVITGPGPMNLNMFLPAFITYFLNKQDSEDLSRCQKACDTMRAYIMKEIDDHDATFDENNIRDFVDIYCKNTRSSLPEERKRISKPNMFRIIFDLFLAGTETTFNTLDWAMLFLLEYPDARAKCQEEIQRVIGDRPIYYADRKVLPYVNATVCEVQRLANTVPLSGFHAADMDMVVSGYDIPKGTLISPNIYASTMDPKYWPQPEKFNPGRFLDASGNMKNTEALIPFSVGPRICLGESLAKMELFLIIANVLQRFTLSRERDDVKLSLQSRMGLFTNSPEPYKIRLHAKE